MSIYIKELIVLLGLSGLVFALGKPVALTFMEESDFKRRRNIWMLLTAAAFISTSFWLFALIAVPTLYWGGKKDTNPLALYLLAMNVIPAIGVQIPTDGLGINQLFSLDIFRLLSFCILVPTALRLRKSTDPGQTQGLQAMDLLLIAYGALQIALYVPPDPRNHVALHNSPTNVLRETFLFVIDSYVLYYVASRSCSSRRAMRDAMAAFCLACTIMASVAVLESLKHWLLYDDLSIHWGVPDRLASEYMMRTGLLRAKASSGNSLALGYLLAIGLGFWLYLQSHLKTRGSKVAVPALLIAGLFAALSRGPWLGAVAIFFAYTAFGPRGASRLFKSALVFIALGSLVIASPMGTRLRNTLPFLGGRVADSSLVYRERLLERAWQLIEAHPLLGDQNALSQMQELRQGQGIIDLVNAYVGVTLFYGFVGLTAFLGFIFLGLSKAYRAARQTPPPDSDWPLLGASLAACIVGTLLMLADCGFFLGYVILFYVLAGLSAAYARLRETEPRPAPLGISAMSPTELH